MTRRFQFSLRTLLIATAAAALFSLALTLLIKEYQSFSERMRHRYEVEVPRLIKEGKPLPWERGYVPQRFPAEKDPQQ